MPTGRPRCGGYALLVALVTLALLASLVSASSRAWRTAAQREREQELVFRGEAIRQAITSYVNARPSSPEWPASLDDLLQDRRFSPPRPHLRRRYVDPFTGQADWVLITDPSAPARFYGVRSRATATALNQQVAKNLGAEGSCVCDWRFVSVNGASTGGVVVER